MDVGIPSTLFSINISIREVTFAVPDLMLCLEVSCLERVLVSSVLEPRKVLLEGTKGWSELIKGFKELLSVCSKIDV